MRKIAIAIEQEGPTDDWKVVGGPTEDVSQVLAFARSESVKRGGGNGILLVLSTVGVEKRYKIGKTVSTRKAK